MIIKTECLLSWMILNSTAPQKTEIIEEKKEKLTHVERLYDYRSMVIQAFEDGYFPFKDGFQKKARFV